MQQIDITLTPEQYDDKGLMRQAVAKQLGTADNAIGHIAVVRRSLDSRRRQVC